MNKTTKPILRWQGGKTRMLKQILPLLKPHACYVEPFFGGGAVLFAKERSSTEVINDLNGNLVALYRNLQFHLPALLGELDCVVRQPPEPPRFRATARPDRAAARGPVPLGQPHVVRW
jgi:site-specific DNA-adenine methylase